jgi:hypothetical protein
MTSRLAYLALSCLAACSSSHASNGTDATAGGDAPLTADTACADSAAARCAKLSACSPADLAKRWGDLATCEQREKLTCTEALAAPTTANTPATVVACSSAITAESCGDLLSKSPPTACLTQHGAGADASACAFAAECSSGFCALPTDSLCATCTAQPAVGDSCATTTCGQTLVCASPSKLCQMPVGDGGACSRDLPCAEGWTCVGAVVATSTMGVCTVEVTNTTDTCDPKHATHADCSADAGLTCDSTTTTCVAETLAAPGEACGAMNGITTKCSGAATCALTTGMTTGTCTAPAADGAACDDTNGPTCFSPAKCVGGTCQLPGSTTCQ